MLKGAGASDVFANWAAAEAVGAGCRLSEELAKLESPRVSLGSSVLAVSEKRLTKLPIRVQAMRGVVRMPSHIRDTPSGEEGLESN